MWSPLISGVALYQLKESKQRSLLLDALNPTSLLCSETPELHHHLAPLSPVDMQAQDLWGEYTMRKFQMLLETNTSLSPWTIVRSDNKKKARINCMKYILSMIEYEGKIGDEELIPDSKVIISGIDELKMMEANIAKPHKLPG
jgi:hypothetical protein